MDILLYRIISMAQKWLILCPEDKKGVLRTRIHELKTRSGMLLYWVKSLHR